VVLNGTDQIQRTTFHVNRRRKRGGASAGPWQEAGLQREGALEAGGTKQEAGPMRKEARAQEPGLVPDSQVQWTL